MGAIRETSTGQVRVLEPRFLVGRAPPPVCSLTLTPPLVSGVHAELRWSGQAWEIRDLGSTNGTFVNGVRIAPSVRCPLGGSSRVGFGSIDNEWALVDASAPGVMAVPLAGGDPLYMVADLLALPSSEDPRATIYRSSGSWVLESPEEGPVPLSNLQVFEAGGRAWRFSCPEMAASTAAAQAKVRDLRVTDLHLSFLVSSDEEHVTLSARCGERIIDLGSYAHHYALLTLARQRIADIQRGSSEASCGWADVDRLARGPSMSPPQLNLSVYRIREQFAREGVLDAAAIVERRSRPRQLRIGTPHLLVTRA